jgi:SAM-dependent methyltransferase
MLKRGIKVIIGTLESAETPLSGFDAVTALDVLEHFYSPARAVAAIARSLKPGGLFIFETGTTECRGAALLRSGWYYSNYLEHFQMFNSFSLDRLLSSFGFERLSLAKVYHDEMIYSQVARALARMMPFLVTTLFGCYSGGWDRLCRAVKAGSLASPPSTGLLEKDHLFGVYQLRNGAS